MHSFRPLLLSVILALICSVLLSPLGYFSAFALSPHSTAHSSNQPAASSHKSGSHTPGKILLDSHLPAQTISTNAKFNNFNAKFGSRFDFVVAPWAQGVWSGTDGVFHDSLASYIVGIAPTGTNKTSIFHMGTLDSTQGDTYVLNEHWTQGLDTTRWEGDASDGSGMHITVDFIDTFAGEPGCTAISACAGSVQDDTVPALMVGVNLQNNGSKTLAGRFLFGSNRKLPASNACVQHMTAKGNNVNILSYDPSADITGGTLFLTGSSSQWACNTALSNRAGLSWSYNLGAAKSTSAYFILGGWNASQNLFDNSQLPSGCQREGLYAAQEWTSQNSVIDFAIDNLFTGNNLFKRAQSLENILVNNKILTTSQRWILTDTLRSYKASSWLLGRQSCAGGGYDAVVSEGSYGFLSTVDVMHEYGYFEINLVPWFFRSEMSIVMRNATSNVYGIYFQHDQGGAVNSSGSCTTPGAGIPTLRFTCYTAPFFASGAPMPVEENSNVALLTAYYVKLTGDTSLVTSNINLIDQAMMHNARVGDPNTGIAYNFQDTNTTFDDQRDCLHNDSPGAGNLYYQGLKEATGYRAAAYLDSLVSGDTYGAAWTNDAAKIENALVQAYNTNGFIPIAENNTTFNNCNGRSVVLGEGMFYLHLAGLDTTVNSVLLQDLAKQYPSDLSAGTLASPVMIVLESSRATGSQCPGGSCPRYEWFSKVMLSSIVADLVYSRQGCTSCSRLDVTETPYDYNLSFSSNYGDGLHDNGSDWGGHFYPRGIISWAFLNPSY